MSVEEIKPGFQPPACTGDFKHETAVRKGERLKKAGFGDCVDPKEGTACPCAGGADPQRMPKVKGELALNCSRLRKAVTPIQAAACRARMRST
jgi:hypothetical protein